MYVTNRIKPENEQIYYIVDAINEAINRSQKISFQYYEYTGLKEKSAKKIMEKYTVLVPIISFGTEIFIML